MKTRTKLIGIAFIMLALIISVSACVTKAETTYAGQITEGILQAMNEIMVDRNLKIDLLISSLKLDVESHQ